MIDSNRSPYQSHPTSRDLTINPALTASTLPVPNPTPSTWITSHPTPIATQRSTVILPTITDIAIIGSGISAVFAARHLLLHSPPYTRILILEARDICSGATGRNGGHLQPIFHEQAHRPDILDFELANFNFIADLIDSEAIDCDFRPLTGIMSFWSSDAFAEAKTAISTLSPRFAHLVEVIEDPNRIASFGLRGDPNGAILQHTAATFSPYKLITSLWSSLLAQYPYRLSLHANTPATSLTAATSGSAGRWTMTTPRGTLSARQVLLATNGYTSALLPQFTGLIAPVRNGMIFIPVSVPAAADGEAKTLQHSYGFFSETPSGRWVADHVVQTPLSVPLPEDSDSDSDGNNNTKRKGKLKREIQSSSFLMFGGGRALTSHSNNGAGLADDSCLEPRVERYLSSALPKLLGVNADVHASASASESESKSKSTIWAGIMGYSRDRAPWVGRVPGMAGLWVCGGYSGHGMPLASGCGVYVAGEMLMATGVEGEGDEEERDGHARTVRVPAGFKVTVERIAKARGMGIAGLGARV